MPDTPAQHQDDPRQDSAPAEPSPGPDDAVGQERSRVDPTGAKQAVANEEAALETGKENTA
jgi:hypothetical protein